MRNRQEPPDSGVRISRLYLPQSLHSGQQIQLNEESAHYVRRVLRLKTGAALVIFNGLGGEFSAQLNLVSRHLVIAEIGEWQERDIESSVRIEVGLGISRGERMDFAIRKAVELGVFKITPLLMVRCVVQLRGDRAQQKHRHWLKIAQSASEQSGRNRVPELAPPAEMDAWLVAARGLKIILDPSAEKTLGQIKPSHRTVCLLSGPEGGFGGDERASAIAAGFVAIRLGPRILRTETAALAAVAAIQTLWGDFS